MENKVENHEKNFLILKLLKRNWLLMAIITILITLCFIAYNLAFTKPVYTASRSFILRTELVGGSEMANGALAVDVLLPQIEDNFTSQKYNQMANEEYQKSEYVKYNDSTISRNAITFIYSEGSLIARLAYTDADAKVAVEKLKAVFNTANTFFADGENIQAYTIRLIPTDNSEYDYSRFVVTEDSSTTKFIVLGLIAGLAISFIVVVIKNALDNTVKDKHELEELTETNVLAIIEKKI